MKRIIRLLGCVLITVSMVQNVFAIEGKSVTTAYTQTSSIKIVSSAEEWKAVINDANENLLDKVTVKINNFNKADYDIEKISKYNVGIKAQGTVMGTTAEITYIFEYSGNFKLHRVKGNKELFDKLDAEEKQAYNKAEYIVNAITNENMTEYEKELAIHDYLIKNSRYDDNDIENIPVKSHNADNILNYGVGVCEAYANAFKLMCNMAGIECELVTGEMSGVNHMWNIVKIDGQWYQADVTADDPLPDVSGRVRYGYFNLNDSEMAKTHTWDTQDYPVCNSTVYNYYVYNGLVVDSRESLQRLLKNKLDSGENVVMLRTKGYIINSSADIKNAMIEGGYTSVEVYGEYGKEGSYVLIFK